MIRLNVRSVHGKNAERLMAARFLERAEALLIEIRVRLVLFIFKSRFNDCANGWEL